MNPDTKEQHYFGGARTREAGDKRVKSYEDSKDEIRKWGPFSGCSRMLSSTQHAAFPDTSSCTLTDKNQ